MYKQCRTQLSQYKLFNDNNIVEFSSTGIYICVCVTDRFYQQVCIHVTFALYAFNSVVLKFVLAYKPCFSFYKNNCNRIQIQIDVRKHSTEKKTAFIVNYFNLRMETLPYIRS